ncbi:hypothetical protein GOP47_0018338 [Adiantum capillus-veneris]|uniref:Uncharacterized protein n=1 Tax=Adiantum capillus-veneris TaxID=13818 RepID=A0A9D4ZBS5_ADICA|nr:hypothetical protein GOP47_0030551 [Adiantum capillus-veneris]KAI5067810.1 hypothetical protein GOP47_0018338 [Adiantum capillus-veneris]
MGLGKTVGMGAAVVAAGVAAMPLLLPEAAEMVGFGGHGIAAGSWAAAWMRSYGGHVPAGSLCALLQRVGSRGRLESSSVAVVEVAAMALAGLSPFLFRRAKAGNVDGAPAVEHVHYELLEEEEEEEAAESCRVSIDGDGPISLPSPTSEMEEPAPSVLASPASNTNGCHEEPSMLINPFAHLPAAQEPSSSTNCSCVILQY